MGNKIIEALIDSGCSFSLILEDVSKGIIEPSRRSKDIAVLFGLRKYEPKKTETTSVSLRIVFKDDIAVYQSARRLAFSENQDVNKQIDEWLEQGIESKVYTTLDLKNGFFHVDVNEDSKHLISFVVPDRQFQFNKVPFGLSTSPSVFQRYVYSIFRGLMRKGVVIIYMDDLRIPAKDEKEKV
ncbi:retrovirus-related Pol polyprotein from transposon 17.6 [Trichonephila clavipes]|nr:retrovirus-related Pol polyprotein from transposon 17.6 [Trichonephila clavipes]